MVLDELPRVEQARPNRVRFLDSVRGCAVLLMIMQHAILVFDRKIGEGSLLGLVWLLGGTAPAAPVFLFLMGVFIVKTPPRCRKALLRRGFCLIAGGYALSVGRFVLPAILQGGALTIAGETATPSELFFAVDILQVAGLCLIAGAALGDQGRRLWIWLPGVIALPLLGPWCWGLGQGIPGMRLLWGSDELAAFPLIPWLIYPLLGMGLSRPLRDPETHGRFLGRWARWGLLLIPGGIALCFVPAGRWLVVGDYARSGLGVHVGIVGFLGIWLWLWRRIHNRWEGSRFVRSLSFWSRHVTAIYCVQWLLFGWATLAIPAQSQSTARATLLGVIVIGASDVLVRLGLKATARRKDG